MIGEEGGGEASYTFMISDGISGCLRRGERLAIPSYDCLGN